MKLKTLENLPTDIDLVGVMHTNAAVMDKVANLMKIIPLMEQTKEQRFSSFHDEDFKREKMNEEDFNMKVELQSLLIHAQDLGMIAKFMNDLQNELNNL